MKTKTEREIFQQHEALEKTYAYLLEHEEEIRSFFDRCGRKKIVFMGCGSSYMLAKSGQRMFGAAKGVSSAAIAGGDYLMCPNFYQECVRDSLVVVLSRSGKTSEMVRALEILKKQENCTVLAMTAAQPNDFSKYADLELTMDWCYDLSVCQTRTVTNFYLALSVLFCFYRQDTCTLESLRAVVRENEKFQEQNREQLCKVAERDWNRVVVLANGPFNGIAQEGALAFTEIAMVPGCSYSMLDYLHGPIVLNDRRTLTVVLLQQTEKELQRGLLADLKKRGGFVLAVGQGTKEFWGVDALIDVGKEWNTCAVGIPFLNTIQILAYEKAVRSGVNPDQPEGLDAYILL